MTAASKTSAPLAKEGKARAAATRGSKGSVHEAIGMLMGDDAARERGKAEKSAASADASDAGDS
jgi:uncharacterized protein YjbJ (UPF0337 family)